MTKWCRKIRENVYRHVKFLPSKTEIHVSNRDGKELKKNWFGFFDKGSVTSVRVLSTFRVLAHFFLLSGSVRFLAKPGFWFGSFLLDFGFFPISSF